MNLKRFTTILIAPALFACTARNLPAVAAAPAPAAPATRPNIIFIMTDDHAVQALSAYGHPLSKLAPTPNIDRIAKNGATFVNSFVTNSLCGPSRAAMLTGKFGHINGFTRNGETFNPHQPTWPRALSENGYQTAVIGKWHIGRTPEGLKFDYWKVLDDQGEYYNPDFITAGGKVRVEGYAQDLITDYSIDWLKTQRDPSRPFVLMMHHKAPHRNFMPALRHLRKFENVRFPVPTNYFDNYAGRPAAAGQEMNVYRDMYEGHDLKMTKAVGSTELRYNRWPEAFDRMTPGQRATFQAALQPSNDAMNAAKLDEREMALWKYQRYMEQYLGTLVSVDESVGRVLDYLEQSGLSENTIVVYTSDQGFFLGEHGWFDKRFMYEESFRTPLLVQFPGRIPAGVTVDALVQNIDIAPTFLDYAGLPIPADIQGRSLRQLTETGSAPHWRDSIYYHYYEFPDFHRVRAHYGVRDQRYKLMHFYGDIDAWEFYDLQRDPTEMQNRIADPKYRRRITHMKAELERLRRKYRDNGAVAAAAPVQPEK